MVGTDEHAEGVEEGKGLSGSYRRRSMAGKMMKEDGDEELRGRRRTVSITDSLQLWFKTFTQRLCIDRA
jgi:hypothetical protein